MMFSVRSACKIFVGKITEDLTVQDLREHFEEFGTVKETHQRINFNSSYCKTNIAEKQLKYVSR